MVKGGGLTWGSEREGGLGGRRQGKVEGCFFWLYKYEGICVWAGDWVLGRGLGVGEVQEARKARGNVTLKRSTLVLSQAPSPAVRWDPHRAAMRASRCRVQGT